MGVFIHNRAGAGDVARALGESDVTETVSELLVTDHAIHVTLCKTHTRSHPAPRGIEGQMGTYWLF